MTEYKTMEDYDTGLTCKIYYDDAPLNPRKDWDPLCKIVVPDRNRYLDNEYDLGLYWDDREHDEAILNDSEEVYMWRPLYVYDHSGVSFSIGSFGDPWDSGQIGYIVALKKDVEENWGKGKLPDEKVREYVLSNMKGEIEALDQCSNGEVYGYIITDEDDEEVDQCWGFFGDDGLEEIKEEFKSWIESKKHEMREEVENENPLFMAAGIDPETLEAMA